ncbi:twin-arginine translocation signal domain-containing protein [Arthrobacter sp. Soil763]
MSRRNFLTQALASAAAAPTPPCRTGA